MLDDMCKRKSDMVNEIFEINIGGDIQCEARRLK